MFVCISVYHRHNLRNILIIFLTSGSEVFQLLKKNILPPYVDKSNFYKHASKFINKEIREMDFNFKIWNDINTYPTT